MYPETIFTSIGSIFVQFSNFNQQHGKFAKSLGELPRDMLPQGATEVSHVAGISVIVSLHSNVRSAKRVCPLTVNLGKLEVIVGWYCFDYSYELSLRDSYLFRDQRSIFWLVVNFLALYIKS